MKTIELEDRKLTKEEIMLMDIPELNNIMFELQELIHETASEKNKLTTLPKSKKNGKTIAKVQALTDRIMKLQDAVNFVSVVKKNKRDVQSKERDFFKLWVQKAQLTLRKSLYEKIEAEVTSELGYGRL